MRRLISLTFIAAVSTSLLLQACSSESSSSPTGGNACQTAGTKYCEKACACGGDKCRFANPPTDGGTGGATISFDNLQKCTDLMVGLGCSGGGKAGFDYAKCSAALDSAACISTSSGKGLVSPPECDTR